MVEYTTQAELDRTRIEYLEGELESAWGLIANSYGGDWELANKDWRKAAVRWRESYHNSLRYDLSDEVEDMG
jgi:hypothetical protein